MVYMLSFRAKGGNLLRGSTLLQVAANTIELFNQHLLFALMPTIVLLKTVGS